MISFFLFAEPSVCVPLTVGHLTAKTKVGIGVSIPVVIVSAVKQKFGGSFLRSTVSESFFFFCAQVFEEDQQVVI